MMVKPTTSEELIPLNGDLTIHYSVFKDGFTFRRPAGTWKFWRELKFAEPQGNEWLEVCREAGVEFTCCEHVSLATEGYATYDMQGREGILSTVWTPGMHNLSGGKGYLPADAFTRTFHNSFTLCCIVQPYEPRVGGPVYSFEVFDRTFQLQRPALAVHFCGGGRAKQTDINLSAGVQVPVDNYAIAVYSSQ